MRRGRAVAVRQPAEAQTAATWVALSWELLWEVVSFLCDARNLRRPRVTGQVHMRTAELQIAGEIERAQIEHY
jgi:hypothetical protein